MARTKQTVRKALDGAAMRMVKASKNIAVKAPEMSDHHTQRCATCKKNMWRKDLEISWPATQIWSFSGPPTYIQE